MIGDVQARFSHAINEGVSDALRHAGDTVNVTLVYGPYKGHTMVG